MQRSARALFAIVAVCFLASGAAGLIYQVVWARYLALFLGHTSYAIVAVLVAFMGGLAIGNAGAGVWADRSERPLAIYGWLEVAIGVYAVLFPAYYGFCHDAFIGLARVAPPGSAALLGLKFAFGLAAILLPTVLMGATFPVLTRFVTRSLAELRENVAALYALNSAGAVAGCLVADYWWIPAYGLDMSMFGAAALNLGVGVVAIALSLRMEGSRLTVSASESTRNGSTEESCTPAELRFAIVAIGVSGFVAMIYEVAWTRLLALALGSSTHAFSLMLVTFITGIAGGAGVVYRWRTLRRSLMAFGWAELALAATLFGSMFFYQYLSYWFVKVAGLLARREEAYFLYQCVQAGICFAVMFLPALCLGMTLPLISRAATMELARTGRSVGRVFAVNTLGTVLGAIAAGLWLMPSIGLARTLAVGIGLNALVGLIAVGSRQFLRQPKLLILPLAALAAVLWIASSALDATWRKAFSLGIWRNANPPGTVAAFREVVRSVPLLYHKDGAGATVDVYSWNDAGQERLTLKVNGKADAGTASDMITQLLLGHVPMLLRPATTNVLVVGLGSGMTCSAVARHPSVQRIDAVEISPEVLQAARLFSEHNDRVLSNPKLRVVVEDAKTFLKSTGQQYELIIAEPSNPWMAGVAGVFSREYYESCAARLTPSGVVAQWMHIYETTDEAVDLVMRTFLSVFPYMSVWQPALGDLVLVGSRQPLQVDVAATTARFGDLPVQEDLARVGLLSLSAVLAREIVPQQNGIFIIPAEGPVHSDFYPSLEYVAQRGFFLNGVADRWARFREDFSPRATTILARYLQTHPLANEDFNSFVRDYQEHRMPESRVFRSLLHRWQSDSTTPAFPIDLWAMASERTPAAELRALRVAPLRDVMLEEAGRNPVPLRRYAADLMETYRSQRSVFYLPPCTNLEAVLERLLETDPNWQRIYKLRQAEIAWDRGDDARCLELGQSGLDADPVRGGPIDFTPDQEVPRAVLYRMAEVFWRSGRVAEAWQVCEQARAGGYLIDAALYFPLLEVTYRRVEAAVRGASVAQNAGTSRLND